MEKNSASGIDNPQWTTVITKGTPGLRVPLDGSAPKVVEAISLQRNNGHFVHFNTSSRELVSAPTPPVILEKLTKSVSEDIASTPPAKLERLLPHEPNRAIADRFLEMVRPGKIAPVPDIHTSLSKSTFEALSAMKRPEANRPSSKPVTAAAEAATAG